MNNFLGRFGVFSGFSETKRGKNKNLFYFRGFRGAAFILFCGGGGGVHWVQVVHGVGAAVALSRRVPCLCPAFRPLCRFCFPAIVLYYALFRVLRGFLAGFGVVVCVCLSCVLCAACGAFVCVSS